MSKDEDTQEINIDDLVKIRERPKTNDKFALVSFDGYAITERGDKVKTKWFENIDTTSNSYRDILLTPLEAKRLVQAHRYIKVGASMQGLMTCFPPGTGVTLPNGTNKPIEDLQIGVDKVITHKGRARLITEKKDRFYSGALFSFQYGDGRGDSWTPKATAEHPFFIKERGWVKAADVKRGDKLLIPFTTNAIECSSEDLHLARLLGYYVAEGSVYFGKTGYRVTTFTFNIFEESYHQEVIDACIALGFKNSPKFYPSPEKNVGRVIINGQDIAELMIRLAGRYSHQKILSEEVMNWPREMKREFLIAYLNGDGHWRAERVGPNRRYDKEAAWATVSKELAEQLYYMFCMVGAIPGKYHQKPRIVEGKKDAYFGRIGSASIDNLLEGTMHCIKNAEWDESGMWIGIKSIETEFYEGSVWNLGVEEDESYCVDWIAVHNCFGPSICKRARTCEYCILQEELDMAGDTRRVVPVGKTCPLEKDLFVDTLQKLAEEFDVGPDQYSDQRSILELAEVEVMEARANAIIASDPDLQAFTEEKLMSSTKTKDGDVIDHYVKDVADLMKVKAQLSARKDKIRKELLGTRREKEIMKARIGQHDNDPSVLMSDLNLTLRQMKTAAGIVESNKSKVIDVKPE